MKNNMGAHCTPKQTTFRVFAKGIDTLSVVLYETATAVKRQEFPMQEEGQGIYTVTIDGDYHGWFYQYRIDETYVVTDPYSVSLSTNSERSAIIDLTRTNPDGWETHVRPQYTPDEAIVYEVHVKDFTVHGTSGVKHPGKYLGMAEAGKCQSVETGIAHLKALGITHVHLLPIQDFITVDERKDKFYDDNNFNWGYDPEHYNAPEGSYSTDSSDPTARICELKTLIKALHEAGLSVVLDVVYNHTYRATDSNFNMLAPNYYYRMLQPGVFSNGSGCGNEFATEKTMARQFVLDSIAFWMDEYQVDGFRFDLMALIDRETVDAIVALAREKNPNAIIYGEPWAADRSPLPAQEMTTKGTQQNRGFALFNDDYRNALKGGNDDATWGYVQGAFSLKPEIQQGIAGGLSFKKRRNAWAKHGHECIQYFNSHDNLILADKFALSIADEDERMGATKLIFGLLLTSFGIPFFHAGNEFNRSKQGHHNTYNAPLSINGIDWEKKEEYNGLYDYVRELIHLRREIGVFSNQEGASIKARLQWIDDERDYVIAYTIQDEKKVYLFVHNASDHTVRLTLPEEAIQRFNEEGRCDTFVQGEVELKERSTNIYEYKQKRALIQ